MTLPIDSDALEAQRKAEFEYGERLMDLATERATRAGSLSVTAGDIDWVSTRAMDAVNGVIWRLDPPLRCVCAEKYGVEREG